MRFNIKNWQDKHLIKESKLKEIDFKDKAAFDKYQSKHSMRKSTKVNVAGKDTTAGEAGGGKEKKTASTASSTSSSHASKFTPEQKKSVVSSAAVRISRDISNEFGSTKHPKYNAQMMMSPISKIYMTGMSIDDAMTEIGNLMGTEYENTRMTSYGEPKKEKHSLVPMTKKFEKQLRTQMERVYTGEADSWVNGVRDDEYQNIDPEVDKRVKANAAKQDAIKKKDSDASMKAYKIQQAKDKAEKLKNRTPKEIEKAKTQFKFSEYDYESPKEYRDNVKDILQKTYDLDKVDPDRMQQMIDGADEYFYDEARSAGKAGRRSKPTSAKNFASYIEQYFDEDGIEPKNESVTSRSARIQEAKMYQTIQELKGLERNNMRFNIKNWQDKHLIKESKLKEMDFKDKAAFDKYQSKHKMRSTTKVNVAGKDTTAGEAGGTHAAASRDGAYTFDKGDAKIDYDKEWEKRKARIKSTPDIKSGDSLGKTSSGKDMVVYKNNKAFFEDTKDYTLEDHQEALKVLTDMPHENHINVQNQFKHEDAIDRLSNSPLHQFKEVSKQADKLRSSIERREEDFLNFGYTDKQEAKAKADKKKLKMMDKQVDKLQKKYYNSRSSQDENSDSVRRESVTLKSSRIQEAKIYRTIQELKALEKGL